MKSVTMTSIENHSWKGRLARDGLYCITTLVSGCAVVDPLRQPPDIGLPPIVYLAAPIVAASNSPRVEPVTRHRRLDKCYFAGCIEIAVEYGETWRAHYYQQAQEVSVWRNSLLGIVLPISAFALYRSTHYDNSAKLVAGYASVAGTTYGLSRYFGLAPQQQAYLAGADALTCTLINSRKLMVPATDVSDLEKALNSLRHELDEAQRQYSTFRLENVSGRLADEIKATDVQVFQPIERRLRFYEGTFRRASAIQSDSRTSGEALRRVIDMITNATAVQIVKDAPEPDKILSVVGDFRGFADKIGQGAFPSAPVAPQSSPQLGAMLANVNEAGAAMGQDLVSPPLKDLTQRLVAESVLAPEARPLADKLHDVITEQQLGNLPLTESGVRAEVLKVLEAESRVRSIRYKNNANKDVLSRKIAQETLKNSVRRAVRANDAARRATSKAGTNASVLDLLLDSMRTAGTLEFHMTSANPPMDVKGTFTRGLSKEETSNSQASKPSEREKDIQDKITVLAQSKSAKSLYEVISKAGSKAEKVYHLIVGWDISPTSIRDECHGGTANEPGFSVSPQLTEVTLTVDKPIVFVVSNGKHIPRVLISGQNTDKVKFTIAVSGDDFAVTVTPNAIIPEDQEAILVIGDSSGKRKMETKISVRSH